jgi:hypothetical protein
MWLFFVPGDEEVAMSVSEGGEALDHRMEEAQKGTPVLPHFQYTRASFKLNVNRSRVKLYEHSDYVQREVHNILLGPSWRVQSGTDFPIILNGFICYLLDCFLFFPVFRDHFYAYTCFPFLCWHYWLEKWIVMWWRNKYCRAYVATVYKTGFGLTTGFIGSHTVTHNYSVYTLTAHYSSPQHLPSLLTITTHSHNWVSSGPRTSTKKYGPELVKLWIILILT